MAAVTKNADNTYTVTLTAKEQRALARAGQEQSPAIGQAAMLKVVLDQTINGWIEDHLAADGPTRLVKFAGLTVVKQDAVDAILNGS